MTTLTVIMVGGVLVVIALLVIRLSQDTSASSLPTLPKSITLPAGQVAQAVTFGAGWVAVVTSDGQILIFDAATGSQKQSLQID